MNNISLWNTTLEELQLSIAPPEFKMWFSKTQVLTITEGKEQVSIDIGAPNAFCAGQLQSKYNALITETLTNRLKRPVLLSFKALPADESDSLGPLFSNQSTHQGEKKPFGDKQSAPPSLNPNYTFETFIVGSNNRLAHAVSQSVSEQPGSYNPFFLYSGVGLGKTHLLHAIGNKIIHMQPERSVVYCSMESFMNDLIDAIRTNTQVKFKKRFREADVLLIDDVQSISGKESTQEEFFNTFNALYLANKQIIITSDRPPEEISRLEERLRSRFAGGMLADMQAPDTEMRMAILQAKCRQFNHHLDPRVLEIIARHITSNVRELEGAFKRIMAFELTSTTQADETTVHHILKTGGKTNLTTTPTAIMKTVCDYFSITQKDLKSTTRKQTIAFPRHITMYLIRTYTDTPLIGIGDLLGGRDHTTIMHGIATMEKRLMHDPYTQQVLEQLHVRLRM